MIEETPLVSVLMSVYNTPEIWLRDCIESILQQTFSELEFIIVTDCPTDGSEEIIAEYMARDKRVKMIRNDVNLGLTKNLNKALAVARGKYIARMDADDVSFLHRLEKQVQYMEKHPETVVVGTRICTSLDPEQAMERFPASDWSPDQDVLKIRMLYRNAGVTHPTAMIRSSVLREHGITYDERFKKSQDYKLWIDLSPYGSIDILEEVLLMYRVHEDQISANKKDQYSYAHGIAEEQAEKLLGSMTDKEKKFHVHITDLELPDDDKKGYAAYLDRLIAANAEQGLYNKDKFQREMDYMWCRKAYRRMRLLKKPDMMFSLRTLRMFSPKIRAYTKEEKEIKARRKKAVQTADFSDCLLRGEQR